MPGLRTQTSQSSTHSQRGLASMPRLPPLRRRLFATCVPAREQPTMRQMTLSPLELCTAFPLAPALPGARPLKPRLKLPTLLAPMVEKAMKALEDRLRLALEDAAAERTERTRLEASVRRCGPITRHCVFCLLLPAHLVSCVACFDVPGENVQQPCCSLKPAASAEPAFRPIDAPTRLTDENQRLTAAKESLVRATPEHQITPCPARVGFAAPPPSGPRPQPSPHPPCPPRSTPVQEEQLASRAREERSLAEQEAEVETTINNLLEALGAERAQRAELEQQLHSAAQQAEAERRQRFADAAKAAADAAAEREQMASDRSALLAANEALHRQLAEQAGRFREAAALIADLRGALMARERTIPPCGAAPCAATAACAVGRARCFEQPRLTPSPPSLARGTGERGRRNHHRRARRPRGPGGGGDAQRGGAAAPGLGEPPRHLHPRRPLLPPRARNPSRGARPTRHGAPAPLPCVARRLAEAIRSPAVTVHPDNQLFPAQRNAGGGIPPPRPPGDAPGSHRGGGRRDRRGASGPGARHPATHKRTRCRGGGLADPPARPPG